MFGYDICNNPIWYKNTELTWNNIRQMTGYGNNTFQYGADGIRCRKNNIHYTLDGSRILQEYHEDTGETLTFYYGEKGVKSGMYGEIQVYSDGRIYNGNHRVMIAKKQKIAVDTCVIGR